MAVFSQDLTLWICKNDKYKNVTDVTFIISQKIQLLEWKEILKMSKQKKLKKKARYLSALEHSYPKHITKYSLGNCGLVAELIAKSMISRGLTHYKVVEGRVEFSNGKSHIHTWMEHCNTKYDPCLEQFEHFGDDYDTTMVKYITYRKYSPILYLKICELCPLPDEYIQQVLNNELKSSKYIYVVK